MSTHRAHGDVHVEGLYDDCAACAMLAAKPMAGADTEMLARWLAAATAQPRSFEGTENELVAVKNVLDTLERFGRLAEASPALTLRYLRERWRIPIPTGAEDA